MGETSNLFKKIRDTKGTFHVKIGIIKDRSSMKLTQYKSSQRTEYTFFQRGNVDGQKAHEKMLEISDHQGNANPNNNDTSSHSCQNGCHQKEHKEQILAGIWRKWNTYTLLVGM